MVRTAPPARSSDELAERLERTRQIWGDVDYTIPFASVALIHMCDACAEPHMRAIVVGMN